jgi:isopropylmalate/homocitrate/citramalate synthase
MVRIVEVGPRDGLQNLDHEFTIEERVELIDRLTAARPAMVEAVSFVNDKRVPRMAGAEEVLRRIQRRPGVGIAGLVLNSRGAARALACELDEIRFTLSATDAFNQRNVNAAVADTLRQLGECAPEVRAVGVRLTAVIAVSFGCPFSGTVDTAAPLAVAEAALAAGAHEVVYADTIGCAVPTQVRAVLEESLRRWPEVEFGLHLHNTRNTGYLNAIVGLEAGAAVLDASVGGLGGCPFAPKATGNIATEDLAFILRNMGEEIGLDLPALVETARWLSLQVPGAVTGQVAKAGLFPEAAMA